MWHVMRGALDADVAEVYRHYHVPASNTAAGLMILGKQERRHEGVSCRPRSLRHQASGSHGARFPASRSFRSPDRTRNPRAKSRSSGRFRTGPANLAESLALPGLDAVILSTPTQMHAAQGEQCMRAGKHVMIEIPMADSLADSERLVRVQQETGVVAMAGHTRRFNPSHQWIHKRILSRRTEGPANGRADLFLPAHQYQCARQAAQLDRSFAVASCLPHRGSCLPIRPARRRSQAFALRGTETSRRSGIAMDMSIGLKVAIGRHLHAVAVIQQ